MTLQEMNKFPNQRYHYQKSDPQTGVTLILALFVLTAVTAVSFSLGSLVIREIRSSRYLAQSEPTILTAEAGAETALFFRLRKIAQYNEECDSLPRSELLSATGSRFDICSNFYDKPYNFVTTETAQEVVLLVDPADEASPASGYTSIDIAVDSEGDGVTATKVEVWVFDISDPPPPDPVTAVLDVFPGTSITIDSSYGLDPSKSYAIFLYPGSQATPTGEATGTICDTTPCDPATSRGIPSKNPKTFSTGTKGNLIRKLQVQWSR